MFLRSLLKPYTLISRMQNQLNDCLYHFLSIFKCRFVLTFRSTNNVNNPMLRSPSKDGYLMVPGSRQRGSSLPEPREREEEGADLYRLRAFTVSNKRIVGRSDSLQPRHCRSNNSINSSASR